MLGQVGIEETVGLRKEETERDRDRGLVEGSARQPQPTQTHRETENVQRHKRQERDY